MTPNEFFIYTECLFEKKFEEEKQAINLQIIGAYFGEMMAREKRLKKLDHYLKMIKYDKNGQIDDKEIEKVAKESKISKEELKDRIEKMGIVGW